uniref:hypothetical protein n=1 Tax=Megasphaera stantonii TaxID=2144175 RepID=UPI0018E4E382
MAGYYTVSNYENAVLQLLSGQLGYTYVYGPEVEREYESPFYEDSLWPALRRINRPLPGCAIHEAVTTVRNLENGTLLQTNILFMNYLQNGVPV